MVFPCTGRTYYTHFPFLYTPHSPYGAEGRPAEAIRRGGAQKGSRTRRRKGYGCLQACAGGRIGGGLYQRTGNLVDPFGKGGVGMDGFEEIAGCTATLDGEGGFGDQIGSVGSGDVRSEELAAAFFNDELE